MKAEVIKVGNGYQVSIKFGDQEIISENWMYKEDAEHIKTLFNDSVEIERLKAINNELKTIKGAI